MKAIGGRSFEVEVQVETPGGVVPGVHDEACNVDGPGGGQGRFHGGLKEGRTKPLTPVLLVHGHSRQNDGGNGFGHAAVPSTPCIGVGHRGGGKRVIPDDSPTVDHDMRLRGTGDLECHGPLPQPGVEFRPAA